jgi:hypothetical protein
MNRFAQLLQDLWVTLAVLFCVAALSGFADFDNYIEPIDTEADRLARSAQEICGYGAAWEIDGTVVQCYRHTGGKTITAEVAQ